MCVCVCVCVCSTPYPSIVSVLREQNLDVNMAVNNLLSRDDDGERGDDSDSQNSYAAGSCSCGLSDAVVAPELKSFCSSISVAYE